MGGRKVIENDERPSSPPAEGKGLTPQKKRTRKCHRLSFTFDFLTSLGLGGPRDARRPPAPGIGSHAAGGQKGPVIGGMPRRIEMREHAFVAGPAARPFPSPRLALSLLLAVAVSAPVLAQTFLGTIRGRV